MSRDETSVESELQRGIDFARKLSPPLLLLLSFDYCRVKLKKYKMCRVLNIKLDETIKILME
jgi:hypothetical protein